MGSEGTDSEQGASTRGEDYAARLVKKQNARWKQVLDVQRPYRWNLSRLGLGRTLDVGCGIGRNLANLSPESVGVDHNAASVQIARERGLRAMTTEEFRASELGRPGAFDSLLASHLLEHVSEAVADEILAEYLPAVRSGGQVVLICPQERGYASDPTHIRWCDLSTLRAHLERHGLVVERTQSFPFPRFLGKAFIYNEFYAVGRVR
ncbi:class I SAM-dependent methyltransferase [Nocardioides campestrisoli]|uniref:class I SAM-dependent methyltransferase n=1 Tax=Nocardioides campestrisoli TaxID=2736757 RepID=UPI001C631B9E|nr:class I SAM-dependent methyltransferase [Nocardioides campestrisoli]